MRNIQLVSRFLRIIFQIGFVILPLTLIISWVFGPDISLGTGAFKIGLTALPKNISVLTPLTFEIRLLGFLIGLMPTLISMYLISRFIKLFSFYENNEIFSPQVVRCIRSIGITFLAKMIIEIVYLFLITLLLMPIGDVSINLSPVNLSVVFLALFLLLNSWIMSEGYKLEKEQQLTI